MGNQAEGLQLKIESSSPSSQGPAAGRELALKVAEAALDKKAIRIEIIDVRGKVDYTDYVIVMSGRSDRQVTAIARGIEEDLKRKHGVRCSGVEGLPQGSWVLLDFGDVVVHIFHQDTRGYYDLEALWLDADRVEFEGQQADEGFVFP
ncbi:MAG: ribosome silencing factor [Deltaproteobacteria bacterium]|nr:ribosome silencing factor [Deltaproteobacteria bacterium]